jgi:hypothetical protein
VPYPAPPDAFVVTVEGFLLPKEDMAHVRYTCFPLKTATLFMSFGVPCPFINALGTPAVYGKNSTSLSHTFVIVGFVGDLSYSLHLHVDHTRRNIPCDTLLGNVIIKLHHHYFPNGGLLFLGQARCCPITRMHWITSKAERMLWAKRPIRA